MAITFDVAAFGQLSFFSKSALRNFPLLVEGYDLTGDTHFVYGMDMSSGHKRVRVFLRALREQGVEPGKLRRAEVLHYATDPFVGLSEAELNNEKLMADVGNSLEARCFTAPGGVLMVQLAFDDPAIGAVSAYRINRLAAVDSLNSGASLVLSPVLARLSRPQFPRDGERKAFCVCDVLHPDKVETASSVKVFSNGLFSALSLAANCVPGKPFVVIRLLDVETGEFSTQILDRRSERTAVGYVAETPDAAIERMWTSMPSGYADGLKVSLDEGSVKAFLMPGVRYRVVGKALESMGKPMKSRSSMQWERFALGEESAESGFLMASVSFQQHKFNASAPIADDDFFITGVWPLNSEDIPIGIRTLRF